MKKLFIIMVLAISSVSISAQEAHISASYTHNGDLHGGPVQSFLSQFRTQNIGGVDAGFSSKVAGPFGLALDLNYSQGGDQVQLLFMGGPELSTPRGKKVRVFAHALVGGARLEHKIASIQNLAASLSDASFAYALGGGFEHYFGKHVGLRIGGDYIYTDAFHASEHNARITGGIAFRW